MDQFWVATDREVVKVSGPDALTYLQGQVSQDLLPMAIGDRRWTFLLQPTGKVDVLAAVERVADDDVRVRHRRRLRRRARRPLEPLQDPGQGRGRTAAVAVLCVVGGDDVIGPDPQPPDGVREGTATELEAARVGDGWPAMGVEIAPGDTIPAETGVVAVAVDFRKGCYPGQELVERMDSAGPSAPRSLRIVDVDDGAQPGDPIEHDGQQVGRPDVGRRWGRPRLRQARRRRRSVAEPLSTPSHEHDDRRGRPSPPRRTRPAPPPATG